MILGASNCAPDNRHVDDLLPGDRMRNRAGIETCIRRAVDARELVSTTNVRAGEPVSYLSNENRT